MPESKSIFDSTSHYQTVFEQTTDPAEKVTSLEWIQMLINLGDYRQARQFLVTAPPIISEIGDERLSRRATRKCYACN